MHDLNIKPNKHTNYVLGNLFLHNNHGTWNVDSSSNVRAIAKMCNKNNLNTFLPVPIDLKLTGFLFKSIHQGDSVLIIPICPWWLIDLEQRVGKPKMMKNLKVLISLIAKYLMCNWHEWQILL